jgi:hypothetical protein
MQQFRNEELTQELNDIDQLTEKRLDDLLDMFLKDFEAGRVQVRGWPAEFPAYKVAKAAMNAHSRILARRHPALCVNCADPGFTSTDMTLNTGCPYARGRCAQHREGGFAARRRADRCVLPGGPAGIVPMILVGHFRSASCCSCGLVVLWMAE